MHRNHCLFAKLIFTPCFVCVKYFWHLKKIFGHTITIEFLKRFWNLEYKRKKVLHYDTVFMTIFCYNLGFKENKANFFSIFLFSFCTFQPCCHNELYFVMWLPTSLISSKSFLILVLILWVNPTGRPVMGKSFCWVVIIIPNTPATGASDTPLTGFALVFE